MLRPVCPHPKPRHLASIAYATTASVARADRPCAHIRNQTCRPSPAQHGVAPGSARSDRSDGSGGECIRERERERERGRGAEAGLCEGEVDLSEGRR